MKLRLALPLILALVVLAGAALLSTEEDIDPALLTKEYFYNEVLSKTSGSQVERIKFEGLLANVLGAKPRRSLSSMTFRRQEHQLTCEVAALRMALNHLGEPVTEEDLLKNLTFSTTGPMTSDGVWGDPNVGFVGDVNGNVYKRTGYGVYAEPIAELASKYASSAVVNSLTLPEILALTRKQHPVIVWGLLSNNNTIYWNTPEGKQVTAFPGEHARIILGYTGPITRPREIILMDPLYGKIKMNREKFLADWDTMGRRAVVVYR
jgi:uncharacterized protein YvpB